MKQAFKFLIPAAAAAILTLTACSPQPEKEITITANGVDFKMVFVKGGRQIHYGGTPLRYIPEQRRRDTIHIYGSDTIVYRFWEEVDTTDIRDFYLGQTEVTQALYEAVMDTNPSFFKGADLPVERVSLKDVETFIERLNSLTGREFYLPTQTEWRFAETGGIDGKNTYQYAGSDDPDVVAWFGANSDSTTHPVATKQPNELGFYDMHGNVEELIDPNRKKNQLPEEEEWECFVGGCWISDNSAFTDSTIPYNITFGNDTLLMPRPIHSLPCYYGYLRKSITMGFRIAMRVEKKVQVVAVSHDNYNMVYRGIANPLTIAAEGYACRDLIVAVDDTAGTITPSNAPGHYTLTPNGNAKTIELRISARTKGSIKPLTALRYRAKALPDPVLRVGIYENGEKQAKRRDFNENTAFFATKARDFEF
ncbi:MAG: SUMF1/EgtB/PvdO family nonheme iron enzyme [Bacteroidales bacterium]|nr:SUMF1/EgtB/PvdO family nonheme iron enzyme [Bacteroidales bacterium]